MTRLAILLAIGLAAAPAFGREVDGFPDHANVVGRSFTLLGSGVHAGADGSPEYAMALYVDELDARRAFPALVVRAGGHSHAALVGGDHAQAFVVWGHFSKMAVLRARRAVSAEELQAEVKAGLEAALPPKDDPELDRLAAKLVAMFDQPLRFGQEIILRTNDAGDILLDVAGAKQTGPQSPKLVRALWDVWLGDKVPDPKLRTRLVDRVDLLGK